MFGKSNQQSSLGQLTCDWLANQCPSLALRHYPEEFTIDEYYRLEGNSDPVDNSIVYAISAKDGLKGVFVDAYGVYAENMMPAIA